LLSCNIIFFNKRIVRENVKSRERAQGMTNKIVYSGFGWDWLFLRLYFLSFLCCLYFKKSRILFRQAASLNSFHFCYQ
jgi:hypothetical protein